MSDVNCMWCCVFCHLLKLLLVCVGTLTVQPRPMDPAKDLAAFGYGSVAWKERVDSWKLRQEKMQMMTTEGGPHLTGGKGGDFDDPNGPDLPM
jgi:cellulose synthase A